MKLKIECDCDNTPEFNEYNSAFINTNTKAKIIDDSELKKLNSGILSLGKQENPTLWNFTTGELWPAEVSVEKGLPILGRHLAAAAIKQASWSSTVFEKISISRNRVSISTRFPVNCLNEMLTCPDFCISAILGHRLGDFDFTIKNHQPYLRSTKFGDFELVKTKDRFDGKKRYERGEIDICWGVGLPTAFFQEPPTNFSPEPDIPLHYLVSAGSNLSPNNWALTKQLLMHFRTTVPGLIPTNSRLRLTTFQKKLTPQLSKLETLQLYYSDFKPNESVAEEICELFSGRVIPTKVPYTKILNNSVEIQNGLILSIRAPKHSGFFGLIPEIYYHLGTHNKNTRLLKNRICTMLAGACTQISLENLEAQLNNHCRQVVIARIRARFRSNLKINLDQCGSILLRNIHPQRS